MPRCVARPVKTSAGSVTWTVCDSAGLPISVVDEYLHWLRARPCSVNTVKAYSHHLAWLFTWFDSHRMSWDAVEFEALTDFLIAYRAGVYPLPRRGGGSRSEATMQVARAAIKEFYEYQRIETGRGPANLRLTRRTTRGRTGNPHHFLAHIEDRATSVERNRLSPGTREGRPTIQIIDFEDDFIKMLAACSTARDRLLLSSFYDLGLRVGGATGLLAGDLDVRRQRVTVTRREDNPNGALSKRRGSFDVQAGHDRFFTFYRDYLLTELLPAGIDSDYVFVNLRPPVGQPMSYSNVYDLCAGIGRRAGVGPVNPHVLRHTHATALAKAGWTNAEIAARLGHKFAASADVYIHLANDDLQRRLNETKHLVWPGLAEGGEGI